jgi:hypothetical protein
MAVSRIESFWRLPGCSELCQQDDHDPFGHESSGYARGLAGRPGMIVRTGCLTIDLYSGDVIVAGRPVRLSGREWGVLSYLAERVDTHCTVNEIVAAVWGQEWIGSPGYGRGRYAVSSSAVQLLRTTTTNLRKKLGPAGRLIVAGLPGSRTGAGRRLVQEPQEGRP